MSYRGLEDPTLFSGLTPSLIFRPRPPATHPASPAHPCRTYCRLSCLLRHSGSFHPQRQTRHIARSVALLPRRAASPSPPLLPPHPPQPLFPPVLHVQFCITIRRALRKLPRNFSLPRARDRPPPPLQPPAGQLRAGSINSLSLFARAARANAIHRRCFSPALVVSAPHTRRCVGSPELCFRIECRARLILYLLILHDVA